LFRLLEFPNRLKHVYAFGAVLCVEAGALVTMANHFLAGTFLVATGSAAWALAFKDNVAHYSDGTNLIVSRGLRAASLAILFTVVALMPYLIRGYRFGGSGFAGMHGSEPRTQHVRGPEGDGARDAYVGIVLWPKQEPTKLIAPKVTEGKGFSKKHSTPIVIPFAGVYWFYKAPSLRLPPEPRQAHGSPEMFNIQSTDRRALSMEAHQNLGSLVALSCCRDIRIRIRNADRYPGSVSVELILINTSVPGRPALSLGRQSVRSTRPWMLYDQRPPTTETLDYFLPQSARIQRFDEVMVVFWLDQDRSFAAAKIGIEEFVLVPRA